MNLLQLRGAVTFVIARMGSGQVMARSVVSSCILAPNASNGSRIGGLRRSVAAIWALLAILLTVSVASAATVSQVSSPAANSSYKAGDQIEITVTFSEAVFVTGTPQITLETGAVDAVCSYSAGSGSPTLSFLYTVATGHTSNDLDYVGTSSLALNGGTIRNGANTAATLTLPSPGAAGSLGANKNIRIDTTRPTVTLTSITPLVTATLPIQIQFTFSEAVTGFTTSDITVTNGSVTALTGSGSSYTADITATANGVVTVRVPADAVQDIALNGNTASSTLSVTYDTQTPLITSVAATPISGAYRATQNVDLVVNFSELVTITGIPTLELETGATDRIASYISGSGTSAITFRYTVQAGDMSPDLEYLSSGSLSLNGGTIRDLAGNSADTTLPAPASSSSLSGTSNVIIDTEAPTVTITSSISGVTSLDAIPVEIVFSEPIYNFSLADFSVSNGCASNLRGNGTRFFADIVPRANGPLRITIPAGVANDIAGNLNLAAPAPVDVEFYTDAPKITNVTSSTPNGHYRATQMISIQVSFTEPVNVTGTPNLTLSTGNNAVVNYTSGSGTDTLTFEYTIASGQNSNDLDYIPLPPLALAGGSIRDAASGIYEAAHTFACSGQPGSLSHNKNIVVDTIKPTIPSVTSTTANGAYKAGTNLNVRAQFSETVYVTGTPRLTLETGPADAVIEMIAGSGTTALDFSYTVVDGHNSARLDYTATSAFDLNGAVIQDLAGNTATVTLPAPGSASSLFGTKQLVIDTIPPLIPNVTSTTANGSYKAGVTLNIQAVFSETVYVSGVPRIELNTGIPNRFATYTSGHSSNTLNFSYTVGAGDTTLDLDYLATTSFSTNGGYIRDLAGNDSIVILATPAAANSLSANKNIRLDTTAPTITSIASTVADGSYRSSSVIPIQITFSEPVTVTGTPYLELNTTPNIGRANYTSGSGGNVLTFTYTVQTGENTPDLDYRAVNALVLPTGAAIRDTATNDSVITLAAPGSAGSLGATRSISVDTDNPTVLGVSAITPDGAYKAGASIDLAITLSEPVTLVGTLNLELSLGAPNRFASCSGMTGANVLLCNIVIVSGDTSNDLDYLNTTALSLSTGTASLRDPAGNATNLTLPSPGATGSIGNAHSLVIDTTLPSVVLSSSSPTSTNQSPIPLTITFSEPVSGLLPSSFITSNATLSSLSGAGAVYTALLIPSGQGALAVTLTAAAGSDPASNLSLASNTLERTFDTVRPTVTIETSVSDTSNVTRIPLTITFSEDITGFTQSDLQITNATVVSFSQNGNSFLVDIEPTADGDVSLLVPENVANDAATNGNLPNSLTRVYDATKPRVLSVISTSANGHYRAGSQIDINLVFSEVVLITGVPELALSTGTPPAKARYISGSGSRTISFRYTVASGDNSPDLDYAGVGALLLNDAGVADIATNALEPPLPPVGGANSLAGQSDIVIDTLAPESPSISEPVQDQIVSSSRVTVKGTAEANAKIKIKNSLNVELCSTEATSSGGWSCALNDLEDGRYLVSARASDLAGNDSPDSLGRSFTIDLYPLEAPVFTAPLNGATIDSAPLFAGTAPALKQVRVRRDKTDLCVAQVSASGAWSCVSSLRLDPGRHTITGTTEDPVELTFSPKTTLPLLVGGRFDGRVVMANRSFTPLEGVSISNGVNTVTSGADGGFNLVVADVANPQLTVAKYGWRIEAEESAEPRAANAIKRWLAVPKLEQESYTAWSGSLAEFIHEIKILNPTAKADRLIASLYRPDGSLCAETVVGTITARDTTTVPLNSTGCLEPNGFGLIKLTYPGERYDAELVVRSSKTATRNFLTTYASHPLSNTIRGKSYAFFDNAYHAARGGAESYTMSNELLISNLSSLTQSFTVRRYRSNTELVKTERINILSMGSAVLRFSDQENAAPLNGIYEIEPDNSSEPYVAQVHRLGDQRLSQSGESTEKFIAFDSARPGLGRPIFNRVRHLPQYLAVQYVEIANVSDRYVRATIARVGDTGRVKPTLAVHLQPRETRKIRLSRLLARYEEGVVEINGNGADSIIVTSIMKHYRSDRRLLSMKAMPITESFGDLIYGSYENTRGTNTTLKLSNLGRDRVSSTVTCYANSEPVDNRQFTLGNGRLRELNLSECFGKNQRGIIEINSSTPGAIVADTLRFRRHSDINLPGRIR